MDERRSNASGALVGLTQTDMNPIDPDSNEAKAIALGNDKAALHKRLKGGARILTGRATSKWHYDFNAKTLTGDGFTVQWALQGKPDEPISYSNQQTTVGTCFLVFNPTN